MLLAPLRCKSLSSTTGWTTGGEDLAITGTGFLSMAERNVSYDGLSHQWTKTTADYGSEAGHENAIAVDSNGHVHIVHASGDGYAFTHSVYDGTSWTPTSIKNCEGSYCWDTHMVIDDNDELHAAYSTNTNKVVYMHYDGSSGLQRRFPRAQMLDQLALLLIRTIVLTSPLSPVVSIVVTVSNSPPSTEHADHPKC